MRSGVGRVAQTRRKPDRVLPGQGLQESEEINPTPQPGREHLADWRPADALTALNVEPAAHLSSLPRSEGGERFMRDSAPRCSPVLETTRYRAAWPMIWAHRLMALVGDSGERGSRYSPLALPSTPDAALAADRCHAPQLVCAERSTMRRAPYTPRRLASVLHPLIAHFREPPEVPKAYNDQRGSGTAARGQGWAVTNRPNTESNAATRRSALTGAFRS